MKLLSKLWVFATLILLLLLSTAYIHKNWIKTANSEIAPERELFAYKEGVEATSLVADYGLKTAPGRAISPDNAILTAWIEKLASMEGCKSIGTPDMGSLSYGDFCYKWETFRGFMMIPKYREALAPYAEDHELMNNIGDPSFQRRLTRMIVLNESDKVILKLWYTSLVPRGLGLPPL